jgi:glutaconate CoA-transferase subunit A
VTKHFEKVETLVSNIPDSSKIALAPDYSGCPMEAIRALIKRGATGLHIIGVPSVGFQGDMLIGAGCVETIETAAVTIGEHGLAPRFTSAIKNGTINIIDGTCPAIHAGLQAAQKGIPFMPVRGILGSDLSKHRHDWIEASNPFSENEEPLIFVKAITPDITLIHVPLADSDGNVWVGVRREMMVMAHASKKTLVTYDKLFDGNLLSEESMAPGTIPSLYVDGLALAENGAWPVGLFGNYPPDENHLKIYLDMAKTEEGFKEYIHEYVFEPKAAE